MLTRFLAFLTSLFLLPAPALAEGAMLLYAVNVGKADALLLNSDGALYLIDTGTAESWGQLSCALKTLGVNHLDGVVFTHTDQDHVGGATALAMSPIEIDAWYAPRWYAELSGGHPVNEAAKLRGQSVVWLCAGDELPFGEGTLSVLSPLEPADEENNNSLVLLAQSRSGRMLLMGDLLEEGEEALLEAGALPACDVLKVGHHGGDDATSQALVDAVQPRAAVISTATAERASTPDKKVVERLQKAGAQVAVTQDAQAGVLVQLADGQVSVQLTAWPDLPAPMTGLRITDKNNKDESLRIENAGSAAADLSGCFLRSGRGGELYVFPAGTVLEPGRSLLLTTRSSDEKGDLLWPEKKVWSGSKPDDATLYDAYGRELAYAP